MAEAENMERQSLTEWAYQELKDLFTSGEKLEPLLPRIESEFDLLDAEIAAFIAEGQAEQARLQELIDAIGQEEPQPEPVVQETMVAQPEPIFINGVTYVPVLADKAPIEISMTDEGRILLDTTGSIDLPNLTIDPRDGGEYTSEVQIVQNALDLVQLLQDQVPAPIQTALNETYDSIGKNLSDN